MKIEFTKLRLEKTVSKEQGGEIMSHTLTLSQKDNLEARFTILLKGKSAKDFAGQSSNGTTNMKYKITIEVID